MCRDCWDEVSDKATPITDEIVAAAEAVRELYQEHPVGGCLHVVTDDWNLGDKSLQHCVAGVTTDVERLCLERLSVLTEYERATALALVEGCIGA